MKNIYLIGFMGTGKTTTGKLLAEKMGVSFVDLDIEIVFRKYLKSTESRIFVPWKKR